MYQKYFKILYIKLNLKILYYHHYNSWDVLIVINGKKDKEVEKLIINFSGSCLSHISNSTGLRNTYLQHVLISNYEH